MRGNALRTEPNHPLAAISGALGKRQKLGSGSWGCRGACEGVTSRRALVQTIVSGLMSVSAIVEVSNAICSISVELEPISYPIA